MRYTFNMNTMMREKVNTLFSFPLHLDMSGYLERSLMPNKCEDGTCSRAAGVMLGGNGSQWTYSSMVLVDRRDSRLSLWTHKPHKDLEVEASLNNNSHIILPVSVSVSRRW